MLEEIVCVRMHERVYTEGTFVQSEALERLFQKRTHMLNNWKGDASEHISQHIFDSTIILYIQEVN